MTAICPACVELPPLEIDPAKSKVAAPQTLLLSLPSIHCAACISGVERTLQAVPGVSQARVNLTQKRATVQSQPYVNAASLVAALAAAGFAAQPLDPETIAATATDATARNLVLRIAVAGFAMMNVMLLSVAVWAGAEDATRDLFHWVSAMIAIPAVGFCAQPFFASAVAAVRVGRVNMDVPITLAITLAVCMSVFEVTQGGLHAYFDAALSLTFFLLIGRFLDHRARMAARSAADELAALETPRAMRICGDTEENVAIAALAIGDRIRVVPGTRIPVDGRIIEGQTDLDRALLTGESMPVRAGSGDAVHAGEVTLTGPLVIELTALGRDSTLHRLRALVEVAERARSRYASLADKAAGLYVPLVHAVALLAFCGWYFLSGDLRLAVNIAVAVLIITCPCALALAIPAVSTVATGRLFRRGILVKSPTALERLCDVDQVVFDKTGTLTKGTPSLDEGHGLSQAQFALAATLARGSAHPLARALADTARRRGTPSVVLSQVCEYPGRGVEAVFEGRRVRLGSADWLGVPGIDRLATWVDDGQLPPLPLCFNDTLREGAAETVARLEAMGLPVTLLSGDNAANVAHVAGQAGIALALSNVGPEEKLAYISKLSDAGIRVLMVGDGLNDTAALGAAHVSASPAAAVDASRAVADVVLLRDDLRALPDMLDLAHLARRRMRQNLWIAAIYNAVAVPVAVLGFVTPLIAALAMSGSSIFVSLNAVRMKSS
ncbi:MAG: Cu2+-exporting ATPase [Paracoccaceae bacterium]|jgi:Cu2+-exporting ATPase